MPTPDRTSWKKRHKNYSASSQVISPMDRNWDKRTLWTHNLVQGRVKVSDEKYTCQVARVGYLRVGRTHLHRRRFLAWHFNLIFVLNQFSQHVTTLACISRRAVALSIDVGGWHTRPRGRGSTWRRRRRVGRDVVVNVALDRTGRSRTCDGHHDRRARVWRQYVGTRLLQLNVFKLIAIDNHWRTYNSRDRPLPPVLSSDDTHPPPQPRISLTFVSTQTSAHIITTEEASTHKSATTHAGTCFCDLWPWPLTLK